MDEPRRWRVADCSEFFHHVQQAFTLSQTSWHQVGEEGIAALGEWRLTGISGDLNRSMQYLDASR